MYPELYLSNSPSTIVESVFCICIVFCECRITVQIYSFVYEYKVCTHAKRINLYEKGSACGKYTLRLMYGITKVNLRRGGGLVFDVDVSGTCVVYLVYSFKGMNCDLRQQF